jgi:hypothetical protein
MGWGDRVRRGHEDKPDPVAHLATPAGHRRLELIEHHVHQFGVRGIIFNVEQRKPGVGVFYIADDVTRPGQRTARGATLGNQQRLSSSVTDDRPPGQAVSEVGNGRKIQPRIVVQAMDELGWLLRKGSAGRKATERR